jgi:hydroxymethylpyrimidine kinase/phosphomethylpyrimidine kinase
MAIFKALTIAGSDSGGGAGIQADLKTFAALGVYGCSVITAVTAQNTHQVTGIEAISPQMVRQQLEAVLSDIYPDAIKTGMLADAEIVQTVAQTLRCYPKVPLVVDPVMVAKSGNILLATDAVDVLRQQLIPLADVVTPNLPEAEVLTGRKINGQAACLDAAQTILGMGARAVVLKGGHRSFPPATSDVPEVVDLFCDQHSVYPIAGPWIDTPHTHGTGCTFAAAIASGLAKRLELHAAVLQARQYLTEALRSAFAVGHGKGPVHHFYGLWKNL